MKRDRQKKSPRLANQTRGSEPRALPVDWWSKRYGYRSCRLDGAQVLSGGLASPAVCDNLERDLLPLAEGAHARAFDRADMNEDIFTAVFRLNEAEALLVIKPLHGSRVHGILSFRYVCVFKPRYI